MSRTERMLGDVERGFLALEEGRFDDAESALHSAQRVDRKHADVITLAAALADATGDAEDALENYTQLSQLQPDDPMPRICIARIQLRDLGDADAALDTLEEAFEFIDEEADLVEAIFVKTEALIANEDLEAARATLGELASSAIEDSELALNAADLALSAEDVAGAQKWAELAIKVDPDAEADALHIVGRVHELAGDHKAQVAAWQKVRTLDLALPAGDLQISDDDVERVAKAALAELPDAVREKLEKVPILIDTVPSEGIVGDGFDPRALGLFQGTPMPDDGSSLPAVTSILLFKTNLERFAQDMDHLEDEIRITVLHETAHYFGLDEDDLAAIGLD